MLKDICDHLFMFLALHAKKYEKNDDNHIAVTRIRTWVIAATTQCTNHYTITATSCM